MKSRAVRYHEPFDCRLDTIDIPAAKDNEITCRALYSLISAGSECISFRRQFDSTMHRCSELGHPALVGYSMAAEVIAVGKNVKEYKVGDLVYAHSKHMEYFNIEVGDLVTKIPNYIKPEEACWITVLRAGLFSAQKAQIKVTDSVVIVGLGVFGMASLQFARLMGARRIIAVDPISQRTERAKAFGATHTVTARLQDSFDTIREICNGEDPDSVIDATNQADTLAACCNLCRQDGNVVLIADPPNVNSQCVSSMTLIKYTNIHGIFIDMMTEAVNFNYPATTQKVHETIFDMIHHGRIRVRDMITKFVSPEDVQENYQALYNDRSDELGVVYDWSCLKD